jgi:valyl-tRNA synthetase
MNLPKTYQAKEYEADIYKLWEDSGAFVPSDEGEAFSIVLPPPNATGKLHTGHAAMLAIEDTIVRHQRMIGKSTLWVPGTDHAAIATNAIIERTLASMGKTKHDVGREKFLEQTQAYIANSQDSIRKQIRAMGASVDWNRERYTMEPAMNRIVGEVFIKMFNDDLIYRGDRIVNWDSVLQTTVSDDELEYEEETTTFYTFKYGPFEIGTARPETKFGDKYVVVHPDDKRYEEFEHGQEIELEWINGKIRAQVIKDEAIDMEFGTGAMTITPWHDMTDFEIAERHNLDKEQIIDWDGKLLDVAGEFKGMDRIEAREKIVEKLRKKGLVIKEEADYKHNIARSDRGKAIVEPQIKEQWWIDVNKEALKWNGKKMSLKQVMQTVVRDGEIEILPKRFENIYFDWIDNLRDWNISRQIWWGHRVPAWHRKTEDGSHEIKAGFEEPEGEGWKQDPDTLDTWFSSATWTWSTLIEPEIAANPEFSLEDMLEKSVDFNRYHPTNLMETGYDLIFFWVARMILMTTYVTGQIPFNTVYMHGMVRTKDGKKMSKSTPETAVDPLEAIEKFGTDALRLSMIVGQTPGNDMRLYEEKIASYRNFCNKLWNIARYVEDKVGDSYQSGKPKPKFSADFWILDRLHQTTEKVSAHLEKYEIGPAYELVYHFIWDDFADWYIEASKIQFNQDVLTYVLETVLKITHPFAPFVTETIWDTLKWEETLLITSQWPKVDKVDKKKSRDFEDIREIVTEVRQLQSAMSLNSESLYHKNSDFIEENASLITRMTGISKIQKVSSGKGLHLTRSRHEAWIDVEEQKAAEYINKLIKRREELESEISKLESRLSNKNYTKNAPSKIVQQTKDNLTEQQELAEKISLEIQTFEHAIKMS